jgi:hypothetical protein
MKMKSTLVLSVGLLTIFAFGTAALAQGQAKQSAPAAPAASAPPSEKLKGNDVKGITKEQASNAMETSGTVAGYEANKMIKVKSKDSEMAFEVTSDTKVKGEIKEGANVTVMYKKEGNKMVASAITTGFEKKAEEKKPSPIEKKS